MFVLRRLRAGHGVRFARAFSSDPHAPLNEADVTSKAMRKKLRTQQAPPLALARPPPAPIPEQQQQQHQSQQPSFGAWMLANMVQGAGITLGFIIVLSIFRGVGLMERKRPAEPPNV